MQHAPIFRDKCLLPRNCDSTFKYMGICSGLDNIHVYATTTCDMCWKIEMEGRCVEDELHWKSYFHPMGTSIIQNYEQSY